MMVSFEMRSHISRCPQFVQIQMFDSRACH